MINSDMINKLLSHSQYVVLDIETTGFSPQNDCIIEIAAIKINADGETASFHSLINPNKRIPNRITELTGINDKMLQDKPSIDIILPKFINFIGDLPLVAHNASFDIRFISINCSNIGYTLKNEHFCTLELCRKTYPQLCNHKLSTVIDHLNISRQTSHRAMDDARATSQIFLGILQSALTIDLPQNE